MIVILNVLRLSQFSMYKYLYSETRFKCFSFLLGNFVGVLKPKNESTQNQEQSNSKLQSTPDNSNLQGKQKKVRVIRKMKIASS